MNTLSSYLVLGRIVAVALVLFLSTAPRGFSQTPLPPIELTVVGDNTPIDPGLIFNFQPRWCDAGDLASCFLAQAFSLSSPAYINQVSITLLGVEPVSEVTPLELAITTDLSSCVGPPSFPWKPPYCSGPSVLLVLEESVMSPASVTNLPLTFSFSPIFLPQGSYYLVLSSPSVLVLWAANQVASHEVGIVGQAFGNPGNPPPIVTCGSGWFLLSTNPTNPLCGLGNTNGTFSFKLDGPLTLPPVGGTFGQIARLVVEGPVTPAPGGPVEAQLGFLDMSGNLIERSDSVTVGPGQIESLDVNLSQFVNELGQRIEVQPFVGQSSKATGAPSSGAQLFVTVQVLDALTGFQTVLTPVAQPGSSVPALAPQTLAGSQTIRISSTAPSFAPCSAILSFSDKNGVPLGASLPVNLSPSAGTWLDLNSNALGLTFGRRIEVQPLVTPMATVSGVAVNSVCQVTVEVFDHLTGRTWTSQSTSVASHAVQ
jgi:hypothetical protein